MSSQSELVMSARGVGADPTVNARRLRRGISATWWYTIVGIVFIEAMMTLVWLGALVSTGASNATLAVVFFGGIVWVVSTVPLLADYRNRPDEHRAAGWKRALIPLLIAVMFGVVAGLMSGLWLVGVLPIVQSVVLLNWPPGIRLRVTLAATLVLAGLGAVDVQLTFLPRAGLEGTPWLFLCVYSILAPVMTVISLWWWDVLLTLDRARASEARLAATQERLRVATDVHDLQGHHLQVIALQLELAERLMERDTAAALEQLRAARHSVDDARQGTRDLALRFRSVPLRDEMANAVDLLRAAGTAATATVDPAADSAPADVLGPVVRETTTNVLRHGGGVSARLSLTRAGSAWQYEISNDLPVRDVDAADRSVGAGAGLEGLRRRAADAGGTIDVRSDAGEFVVTMTVPDRPEASR